jgi:hypothetical protein
MALAQQWRDQGMQMQEQARQQHGQVLQMQQQAMESIAQAYLSQGKIPQGTMPPGKTAEGPAQARGSLPWVRQVLAALAPAQPGYVKRCTCAACGAPKKLPTVTAFVYCDYCASLIDYDLRRACEGDTMPGPEYAAIVNGVNAPARAAVAAGNRAVYRDLQKKVYEAYVAHVPMAVSHRTKNDPAYVRAYVGYMAEAAVARAFDPAAQSLDAEMKQRVMALRYSGSMLSQTVEPESFWPVVDITGRQIEVYRALYRSAGLADLDPDRSEHLVGKLAWSAFSQGWLGMLPPEAARHLLERTGLQNEYVPVRAEDGQQRHCGGCGAGITALPGAKAVICEGCGRTIDVGSAELHCASCGGSMTLPAGADNVACPFCAGRVERVGIL